MRRADDDVLDAEAEDEGIDPDDGEERRVAQARSAAPQGAEQLAPNNGHAGAEVHAHGQVPEQRLRVVHRRVGVTERHERGPALAVHRVRVPHEDVLLAAEEAVGHQCGESANDELRIEGELSSWV